MNTVIEGIHIVPELQAGNEDSALELLRTYYAPLDADGRGYAGGRWDAFDPSGTRAASAQVFTADDLLACSLLSAPIPPEAVCQMLEGDTAQRFNALLRAIPMGSDFVDVDPDGPAFVPVHALHWALRELRGVGETRATKLLARKRPFLVPIVDGVVRATAFPGLDRQWKPLYLALNADNRALERHLRALHRCGPPGRRAHPEGVRRGHLDVRHSDGSQRGTGWSCHRQRGQCAYEDRGHGRADAGARQ